MICSALPFDSLSISEIFRYTGVVRGMLQPTRAFSAARLMGGAAILSLTLLPSAADADSDRAPLQFFNGKTEMVSTVKVIMKKPFRSRAVGNGRILSDGTLSLAQQVFDEGEPTKQRLWKIRQVASSHYAGTMTEAVGPVVVDEVDGRYRFKFRMKGNLSVEQWMTPLAGGNSAKSNTTVRKFGMKVASSTGIIRRV